MVRWDAVATGGACLSVSLGLFVCLSVGASLLNEPPATECLVNGQRTGDIGGGLTALVREKGENIGGERGDATTVISKDAACGTPCLGQKLGVAFPCQWDAIKDAVVSAWKGDKFVFLPWWAIFVLVLTCCPCCVAAGGLLVWSGASETDLSGIFPGVMRCDGGGGGMDFPSTGGGRGEGLREALMDEAVKEV